LECGNDHFTPFCVFSLGRRVKFPSLMINWPFGKYPSYLIQMWLRSRHIL
jgi:hypothetical protein